MIRRLGSAALGSIALAGAVAAAVPQHAASLALLAAGTLVVVAAAFVLLLAGPLVMGERPHTALDVSPAPGAPPLEPHGLRAARRDLEAPIGVGSLPPAVRDRLAAAGLDPTLAWATGGTAGAVAALVNRVLDDPTPRRGRP